MFTKNAILAVLVLMVTGALAADKPAVEARLKMEASAQGKAAVVVVHASAPVAVVGQQDGTTKPAVAARRASEAASAAVAVCEHPVANADQAVVNAGYESVEVSGVPAVDMGTKPAVRARQK